MYVRWTDSNSVLGLWIKTSFPFSGSEVQSCVIFGRHNQFAVEITHNCHNRRALYQAIVSMVPTLLRVGEPYWFQTLNAQDSVNGTCLFHCARLELHPLSNTDSVAEFGFCFPRSAFVAERERFDSTSMATIYVANDSSDIVRRQPSDSERLLVNRHGWEVLYFLRSPDKRTLTFTDVQTNICHALQITNSDRLAMSWGNFYWSNEFRDDGSNFYNTYFANGVSTCSPPLKTATGGALIRISEN